MRRGWRAVAVVAACIAATSCGAGPGRPRGPSGAPSASSSGSPSSPAASASASASPVAEACAADDARACRSRADEARARGDHERALALETRACEADDVGACVAVAIATYDGTGRAADRAAGEASLRALCSRGQGHACGVLGNLAREHDVAAWRTFTERGCALDDAWSCNLLGVELAEGTLGATDPPRAEELLRKACDEGFALACANLALVMPAKDADANARATALLARACEGKAASGCRELAIRHLSGKRAPRDEVAGANEAELACEAGDATGCDWLGWALEQGLGRPNDAARAFLLYAKACDGGSNNACYNLGRAYEAGRGVEANSDHAAQLFERSCRGGIDGACEALLRGAKGEARAARLASLRDICGATHDVACVVVAAREVSAASTYAASIARFRDACDHGVADACERGAHWADHPPRGATRDAAALAHLAERDCDASRHCARLAELVLAGPSPPRDPARALALATRGCDAEEGAACRIAARMHEEGRATARDLAKALTLADRGCEAWDAAACDMVARISLAGPKPDAARAKRAKERAVEIRED